MYTQKALTGLKRYFHNVPYVLFPLRAIPQSCLTPNDFIFVSCGRTFIVLMNALQARLSGQAVLEVIVNNPSQNPSADLAICIRDETSADALVRHLLTVENYQHEDQNEIGYTLDRELEGARTWSEMTPTYRAAYNIFRPRLRKLKRPHEAQSIHICNLHLPSYSLTEWKNLQERLSELVR